MIVSILIVMVFILGVVVYYLYYLAPRLSPRNKAESFLNSNRIEEAIVEFKRVLENHPQDVGVHYKLSELYLQQDKIDQAVTHLEKIVELNRYNSEVDKEDVYKILAEQYFKRGEKLKAFDKYFAILREFPSDTEALYHVGFMTLGQELFETSYKYLEQLSRLMKKNFEIMFGAGIAALQSQRTNEAINFFREVLVIDPHSDIANLAMAFALYKKRDFKTSINYSKMVIENTGDENAVFIAKRLLAFLYIETKRSSLGVRLIEDLKDMCINNGWDAEMKGVLFDLGFAYLMDEKTDQTYNYWSQLYQADRNFRNIHDLITRLRKEMDVKPGSKFEDVKSVLVELSQWKENAFPNNFIWSICGLKSEEMYDLASIMSTAKASAAKDKKPTEKDSVSRDEYINLDDFFQLDAETFRSISYRMCEKLGIVIDDILTTYRESDGVDFLGHTKDTKIKTLVSVRRWKGTQIGEIPIRNFAQAVNDMKAKQGIFITATTLTSAGEAVLGDMGKVTVITPDEVAKLLKGLI
ncbi:MAG: tetratricopeptide repeat protein [Spirochaetes bacterium]|nr:tetratricopeptide repeat protein [Spirochaetota bacterium]